MTCEEGQRQPEMVRIFPHDEPLPPPKPGVRHVRVPGRGTLVADDELRNHVHLKFHWPMIVLAVLFLPLLAVEFFVQPERFSWLWWGMVIGLSIVWLAFTIEFIIKVSIAESRFEYCKRNWLDLVIILVPVLRPLRFAQVAKTARVFTLRGVGMKALRYIIAILLGLEFAEQLLQRVGLKAKDSRKDPRDMTRHQLMDEVSRLRRLTDAWAAWHEAHEAFQKEYSTEDGFHTPPPHRTVEFSSDEPDDELVDVQSQPAGQS